MKFGLSNLILTGQKTDWVVSKTLHIITFTCIRFYNFKTKNVIFYVFFALLHMFSRTLNMATRVCYQLQMYRSVHLIFALFFIIQLTQWHIQLPTCNIFSCKVANFPCRQHQNYLSEGDYCMSFPGLCTKWNRQQNLRIFWPTFVYQNFRLFVQFL